MPGQFFAPTTSLLKRGNIKKRPIQASAISGQYIGFYSTGSMPFNTFTVSVYLYTQQINTWHYCFLVQFLLIAHNQHIPVNIGWLLLSPNLVLGQVFILCQSVVLWTLMPLKILPKASKHGAMNNFAHRANTLEIGITCMRKLFKLGMHIQICVKARHAKWTPQHSAHGTAHAADKNR